MPKTVAFLNKKGGVGKTSTTFHLGGELARRGLRILLVDADAQASLTQGVLGPEATAALDPALTAAAVFDESGVTATGDLIHATAFKNLWVLPGSEAAERWNLAEPWNETDRQYLLRDSLEEIGERFDLVLIDCPPHISLWAWSALVAADGVVVPLQAEDYGAQGMKAIRKTIAHVQRQANSRLQILGYLVTMYNKALAVHVTYETYLRQLHQADVFQATVPLAKDYKEAVTQRKPVCEHKPKSVASKAVAALADEFLVRLTERTGFVIPGQARRVA